MKRQNDKTRRRAPARPIELVCVSQHQQAGPPAKEPDRLTTIRGKWAWCPSGAETGHEWRAVESGSLNALRVQLVEVSRLVDVALNTAAPKNGERVSKRARATMTGPKSRGRRR